MNRYLHTAIQALWQSSGLDWEFQRLRDAAGRVMPSLFDGAADPGCKHPYCVFMQQGGFTQSRDSGHNTSEKHEIRDVPLEFRVHANTRRGYERTAKQVAADLADLIMQTFGGHPTAAKSPAALALTHGHVLLVQYQTDYGMREGDEEYAWVVSYLLRVDMPLAISA